MSEAKVERRHRELVLRARFGSSMTKDEAHWIETGEDGWCGSCGFEMAAQLVADAEQRGREAENRAISWYAMQLEETTQFSEEAGLTQLVVDVGYDLHLQPRERISEMMARLGKPDGERTGRVLMTVAEMKMAVRALPFLASFTRDMHPEEIETCHALTRKVSMAYSVLCDAEKGATDA